MAGLDPTETWSAVPTPSDEELPRWRAREGRSRLVVEMPSEVVTGAVKASKLRRIALAAFVERALRDAGVVGLAAVVVGLGGCGAPVAPSPASRAATLAEGLQWAYAMGFDAGRASKIERANCGRVLLADE